MVRRKFNYPFSICCNDFKHGRTAQHDRSVKTAKTKTNGCTNSSVGEKKSRFCLKERSCSYHEIVFIRSGNPLITIDSDGTEHSVIHLPYFEKIKTIMDVKLKSVEVSSAQAIYFGEVLIKVKES